MIVFTYMGILNGSVLVVTLCLSKPKFLDVSYQEDRYMCVYPSENLIFIFWIFSLFQDQHSFVKHHGRKEKSILASGGIRFNSYPPVHGQYDNLIVSLVILLMTMMVMVVIIRKNDNNNNNNNDNNDSNNNDKSNNIKMKKKKKRQNKEK